ncbi:Methylthioribose-1-phosphate isomerase [Vitis vinifera]|uniref:Methylthioribose-1-phosphate isomerase n=1 Tax=Vitis vinifera TaxID=29760 RepID=A0A438HCH0_VITVI|nr:Methylthioribose-1-phosphate isomerase [Vitis vinifera]
MTVMPLEWVLGRDKSGSICYKHGSLQLFDQRKLPPGIVYLEIEGVDDGWHAIRDMVVRGAPTIAIAATLSLVVEVSNLEGLYGTSNDAASFLNSKLDYLVTRRPTTVNLPDVAIKLKRVISNASTIAFEAMSVFQALLEAAEDMLREDVAANREIELCGVSFLQSHIKESKSLSILTHCNTGSLATIGYGTALEALTVAFKQKHRWRYLDFPTLVVLKVFYLNEASWISDALRTIQVKLDTHGPDYFLFQGLKDRGTSSRIVSSINMMTKIKGTVINLPSPSCSISRTLFEYIPTCIQVLSF